MTIQTQGHTQPVCSSGERPTRVLLIEEDERDRSMICEALAVTEHSFEVDAVADVSEAVERLAENKYDVALTEFDLGTSTAVMLFPELGDTPAVIVTRSGSERVAAEAMRWGAYDYIVKDEGDHYLKLLPYTLENTLARKKSEREVISRTEELEMLLYVTSHDLREPVRAISAFSSLLSERCADAIDERGQNFLSRIVAAAGRIDHMLSDVLTLSRVRRFIEPNQSVDLRRVVDASLAEHHSLIQETNASVRIADDLPSVIGDESWITKAVSEIIDNSLKFKADSTSPEIEIEGYVANGIEQTAGLVVRDRGIGIKAEHTERIFSLFQRCVGREFPGRGAGLAISRAIAQQHQGNAWCNPREDGGSSFFISFGISKEAS